MYLNDIASVPQFGFARDGITFNTKDELAAAILVLGYMLQQPESEVEKLIERMLHRMENRMAQSGLLRALMRGADEPAGPVTGTVTVAKDGWVIGGRFAEHNTFGLPNIPPFMGYSLRIHHATNEVSGIDQYVLTVTDQVSPTSIDPSRVGLYHTMSMLAAELKQPRPMYMLVNAFYEQASQDVVFDFVSMIDALNSVEGLSPVTDPAEVVAERYFMHMRDHTFASNDYQLVVKHKNGLQVRLTGVYGIQERTDTLVPRPLLRQDGSRLIGPYATAYGQYGPHATFIVEVSDGNYGDVEVTNQRITELADALTIALWANNVG